MENRSHSGQKLTKWLNFQIPQSVPRSASIGDCIHIIQSFPDDDPPDLLGLHPEAVRRCREIQGQEFVDSLIAMEPRATTTHLLVR